MVNPCLIASYVIAAITFFFTCIALAVTRSHSAGSCGDNMWSMLMATFVLHVLVLPCVVGCMIIPTVYFGEVVHRGGVDGVLASKSLYYGSYITALIVMILVFSTEVWFIDVTVKDHTCVAALNNVTKVGDPLITTATAVYSILDALIIIALLVLLSCATCIFRGIEQEKRKQEQENGQEGEGENTPMTARFAPAYLQVKIDREK